MSSGISIFPSGDEARTPGVLQRLTWSRMMFNNGSPNWVNLRNGAAVTFALSLTQAAAFIAGTGVVYQFGGTGWIRVTDQMFTIGGPLFSIPQLGAFPQPRCLVQREMLRFTRAGVTADTWVHCANGIALSFDTEINSGGVALGGAFPALYTHGFLGYCWNPSTANGGVGLYTVKKQRVVPGTLQALPGPALNVWHVADHRLFAPTVNEPGRYELRINDAPVFQVDGTDPDFPLATAANHRYRPMQCSTVNYAGATGGIEIAASDIFICDGSAEALAYL